MGQVQMDSGLVRLNRLQLVPDSDNLRNETLRDHHDHKPRGHSGIRKTLQIIARTFLWPRLRRDVTKYVKGCYACVRANVPRRKPFGLLKPLPVGEMPWSSLSMDHIEGLPPSQGFDAILIIVCRLLKQGVFIATKATDTARDLARLFVQHVFSKHGLPAESFLTTGYSTQTPNYFFILPYTHFVSIVTLFLLAL